STHAQSLHSQSVHPLGFGDAGGTPLGDSPTLESGDPWSTAWALAFRAAMQCDSNYPGTFEQRLPLPAWRPGPPFDTWYIWGGPAASCSELLKREETLLCASDKLAEIGDAVGDVVWEWNSVPYGVDASVTYPPGTDALPAMLRASKWRIPAQSEKDRFIV